MFHDVQPQDIENDIAGIYSAEEPIYVDGPESFNEAMERALHVKNPHELLRRVGSIHIVRPRQHGRAPLPEAVKTMMERIARISKGLAYHTGRLEADYLRRPNQLCAVMTTALAPLATVSFNMQPANGQAYYRLLGMNAADQDAVRFGFQSLKVGGLEHVNYVQNSPVAPVVAVPWTGQQIREASYGSHLAPWTGQVFDAQTPVTGIIANMTAPGTGDAFTGCAKLVFAVQSDPCGKHYNALKESSAQFFGSWRRSMEHYAGAFKPSRVY